MDAAADSHSLHNDRGRRSATGRSSNAKFRGGESGLRIVRFPSSPVLKNFLELTVGIDNHSHPKITSHFCDVSDSDSVKACFNEIVGSHGKVDHLVTSAGFTENFDAIAYPPDRMRKLWGVDVDGTYFWACEVAKHLMARKTKGSVVMIGSMSGAIVNVPQPQAPYNAAKAAVRHLASSLAVEWAHAGVRVNVISPGYMLTALYVSPFTLNATPLFPQYVSIRTAS